MRSISALAWTTAFACVAACASPEGSEYDEPATSTAPVPHLPSGALVGLQSTSDGPSFLFERRGEVFDARLATTPVAFPTRGRVVMLGGASAGVVRSDTLEWDGFGMQRRVTTGLPGPRFAAVSAFDARRGRVLLVGGFAATSPSLTVVEDVSTWEWNGADWAKLAAENPPAARGAAAGAIHARTGELWMFGGSVAGAEGGVVSTDDLFRFDGKTWSKIEHPAGSPWPSARALAAMAFDPQSGKMMLFGGFGKFDAAPNGYPSVAAPLADTWTWDGSVWTELPAATRPHVEVYDFEGASVPLSGRHTLLERNGELVLGHETLAGYELWRYDAAASTWIKIAGGTPSEVGPNFRILASAFVDPRSNDIVLVGGLKTGAPLGVTKDELIAALLAGQDVDSYFNGELSTELWRYDGTRWSRTAPGSDPGPREGAAAVFDEARQQGLMFGGAFSNDVLLDDTWTWNCGQWIRQRPSGAHPSARAEHAMAYHPGMRKVVLFGGFGPGDVALDDTWTWDGAVWQKLAPASAPAPRGVALMLRRDADVILFGGRAAAGAAGVQDLWRLTTAGQWERLPDVASVEASYDACGAGEAGLGVFLYGGSGSATTTEDDLARLEGDTWQTITPTGFTPADRRACALFGDVHHRQVLLADGLGGGLDTSWNRFVLDRNEWSSMIPRPYDRLADPPRRASNTTYFFDPTTNSATFYGGHANDVDLIIGETWRLRQVGDTCGAEGSCAPGTTCVDGVCCEASACGACESCAMPGNRGVCTARGTVESVAGCAAEEGLACSAAGRCRGANGSSCSDDAQCASNTCIAGSCCSAEGCAPTCIDDLSQRNPNGSITSCGSYVCRGSACLETCTNVLDCSADNVCNAAGKCVGADESAGERPSSCAVGTGSAAPWLLLAFVLVCRRRRREVS